MAGRKKEDVEELIGGPAESGDPFGAALQVGDSEKAEAHGSLLVKSDHVPLRSDVPIIANDLKQGAHKVLDNMFSKAVNQKDEAPTGRSAFMHKGRAIHMDGSVLDKPNRLYIGRNNETGEVWHKREQADRLLEAFFGPMASRVYQLGQNCGFVEKPLLAVAQMLHFQLSTMDDKAIQKAGDAAPDSIFEGCGEGFAEPTGDFAKALKATFDAESVKSLIDKSRYNSVPVLLLLRILLWDACEKHKVRDPGPIERPEAIVQ